MSDEPSGPWGLSRRRLTPEPVYTGSVPSRSRTLRLAPGTLGSVLDLLAGPGIVLRRDDDLRSIAALSSVNGITGPFAGAFDAVLREELRSAGAVRVEAPGRFPLAHDSFWLSVAASSADVGEPALFLGVGAVVSESARAGSASPDEPAVWILPVRIDRMDDDELILAAAGSLDLNPALLHWLTDRGIALPPLLFGRPPEPALIDERLRELSRDLTEQDPRLRCREQARVLDGTPDEALARWELRRDWSNVAEAWSRIVDTAAEGSEPTRDPRSLLSPAFEDSLVGSPVVHDDEQAAAVALARSGRSFQVLGPAGAGVTQTVASIVTERLRTGAEVLVVASRRRTRVQLARALALAGVGVAIGEATDPGGVPAEAAPSDVDSAAAERYARQLLDERRASKSGAHTPGPAGLSLWQAGELQLALGAGPVLTVPTGFLDEPASAWDEMAEVLTDAVRIRRARAESDAEEWLIVGDAVGSALRDADVAAAARELEDARSQTPALTDGVRDALFALSGPRELAALADLVGLGAAEGPVDVRWTNPAARESWMRVATASLTALRLLLADHAGRLQAFRRDTVWEAPLSEWATRARRAGAADGGVLAAELAPYRVGEGDEWATVREEIDGLAALRLEAQQLARSVSSLGGVRLVDWDPLAVDGEVRLTRAIAAVRAAHQLDLRVADLGSSVAAMDDLTLTDAAVIAQMHAAWDRWLRLLGATDRSVAAWLRGDDWLHAWRHDGPLWAAATRASGSGPILDQVQHERGSRLLAGRGFLGLLDEIDRAGLQPAEVQAALQRARARHILAERMDWARRQATATPSGASGVGAADRLDRALLLAEGARSTASSTPLGQCVVASLAEASVARPQHARFSLVVVDDAQDVSEAEVAGLLTVADQLIIAGDERAVWLDAEPGARSAMQAAMQLNWASVALRGRYRPGDESVVLLADRSASRRVLPSPPADWTSVSGIQVREARRRGPAPIAWHAASGAAEATDASVERIADVLHGRFPHGPPRDRTLAVLTATPQEARLLRARLAESTSFSAGVADGRVSVSVLRELIPDEVDHVVIATGAASALAVRLALGSARWSIDVVGTAPPTELAAVLDGPVAALAGAEAPDPAAALPGVATGALLGAVASRLRAHGLQVLTGLGATELQVDLAVRRPASSGAVAVRLADERWASRQTAVDRDVVPRRAAHARGWLGLLTVDMASWLAAPDAVLNAIDVMLPDDETRPA